MLKVPLERQKLIIEVRTGAPGGSSGCSQPTVLRRTWEPERRNPGVKTTPRAGNGIYVTGKHKAIVGLICHIFQG